MHALLAQLSAAGQADQAARRTDLGYLAELLRACQAAPCRRAGVPRALRRAWPSR